MKHLSVLHEASRHDTVRDYIIEAVEKFSENRAFLLKTGEEKGKAHYRSISYHGFWQDIRRLGAGLCHLGLQGKRIALIGENSYGWILSYLSVLCGVGIIIPLDKELSPWEIRLSLERSRADAVIFDEKHKDFFFELAEDKTLPLQGCFSMEKMAPHIQSLGEISELGAMALKENDLSFDNYAPAPEEMATIIFTSGTTSASKAVMLSNRNIATNLHDLLSTETILPQDRNLVFLPLHHTFGSVGLVYFLCCGCTNMFCDGLRYVQKNLKEYKITTFVCVPLLLEVMYRNIWRGIEKKGLEKSVNNALKLSESLLKMGIDVRRKLFARVLEELGGELRFIISGASAIDRRVAKGFNDFGILTVQGYGLTETSPVLTAENPLDMRLGSVGKAFPSVELEIVSPDENGIGEIRAKGGNVMLGYYEMPEETNAVLQDGWFYTGDLGTIDEDGFVFITGRKKNVLVLKSGKNIYPEELEELLGKLPFVKEALVYGKEKDDDLLVAAKIVYDKDYFDATMPETEESQRALVMKDAVSQLNESLPGYQHIKHLSFQTTPFIKTATAKIKRFEEIKKDENA